MSRIMSTYRSEQDGLVHPVDADAICGRLAARVRQLVQVTLAPRGGLPVGVVRQAATLELERRKTICCE